MRCIAVDAEAETVTRADRCDHAGLDQFARQPVACLHFNGAFDDLNRRASFANRHAERGAFDHSGEVGRLYRKVRGRHPLDLEDDVADVLDDLNDAA